MKMFLWAQLMKQQQQQEAAEESALMGSWGQPAAALRESAKLNDQYKFMIMQQLANPNSQQADMALQMLAQNPYMMEQFDLEYKDLAQAQAFRDSQVTPQQGTLPAFRGHANLDDNLKAVLVAGFIKKQQEA